MSPASPLRNGSLSDGEVRDAARRAYRRSLADEQPVSGAELARRFGMSERWGRDRIREVRDGAGKNRDPNGQSRDTDDSPDLTPEPRTAAPTVSPMSTMTEPSERPAGRGGRPWLDAIIMLTVAAVAAAASYGHMLEVAMLSGEPVWIARAFPITVDGLVMAGMRRGADGRRWLLLGAAVSVAANVLAQFPEHATTVGPVVAAWPSIALFGTQPAPARPQRSERTMTWGHLARQHWQRHLPNQYAALEDPDAFFAALDDEATEQFQAIRDGLLEGVTPNDGTIGWAEFVDRVAQANQTALEIVETELIYLPGEDRDHDDEETGP